MKNTGFTVLELLVVVCIAAAAVLLSFPSLGRTAEDDAAARCLNNLRQCGSALLAYASDYDGWIMPFSMSGPPPGQWGYPTSRNTWGTLLIQLDYLEGEVSGIEITGPTPLRCPAGLHGTSRNHTYGMRTTYDRNLEPTLRFVRIQDVSSPAGRIWLADSYYRGNQKYYFGGGFNWPENQSMTSERCVHTRHGGRANAWFLDGRAEACGPFELSRHAAGMLIYYNAAGDIARF